MTSRKSAPLDVRETLRQMREEYWSAIEEVREEAPDLRTFLVFRLGGERYGVPAHLAREVLRTPRIVRVPMLPEAIRGIINLRGEIVAVSDLRPFLGLSAGETGSDGRLVVVRAAGLTSALVVEELEGLRRIPGDRIEPLTQGLAGLPREAVTGQVDQEEGLLVLLDLDYVLSRPQFIIDEEEE